MASVLDITAPRLSPFEKLRQLNWTLLLLIGAIASVGFAMLYSAAGGSWEPWAGRQAMRFGVGIVLLIVVALVDLRLWLQASYLFYTVALALLIGVELAGVVGMGAQRWIDLGIVQLQPSELMKVALIMALARYFHGASLDIIGRPTYLIPPLAMVLIPAALVMRQPDLGTALLLVGGGGSIFFMAGVRWWKFAAVAAAALVAIPTGWRMLRDYQRQRILTFLDPESDPLGAGYHIIQSKIALGSGGVWGKGFLQGTQAHLQFLPEHQTDFIFTMLAEEMGIVGALGLIALYVLLLGHGFAIAYRSRNSFGKLLAIGLSVNFFLYAFINMAMVMGLIPVVGVPLPLVSYGGTAMLALLIGFGLLMGVYVHRDMRIGRRGLGDDF